MKHKLSLFVLVFFFLFYSNVAEAKEQMIVIERINQTIQLTSTRKATDLVDVQPGQTLKDESIKIQNKLKENVMLSCEASVIIDSDEFNSGFEAFFEIFSSSSVRGSLLKQITIAPKQTIEVNAVCILNGKKLGNGTQGKIGKLKWTFVVKECTDYSNGDSSQMFSGLIPNISGSNTSLDNEVSAEQLDNYEDVNNLLDISTGKKNLPKTSEKKNPLSMISIFGILMILFIFRHYVRSYEKNNTL